MIENILHGKILLADIDGFYLSMAHQTSHKVHFHDIKYINNS